MSEKQDRVYPRTALDIERKYNFGKTYAQLMGIAEDHQKSIEEITNITVELSENIDNITARVENTETGLSQTIRVRADGILIKNQNGSVLEIDGGQLKAGSLIQSPVIIATKEMGAPIIQGAIIRGGRFYDDDENICLELEQDEGEYGLKLSSYQHPNLFSVFNGSFSQVGFYAKNYHFAQTDSTGEGTIKFYGTVDLSNANVIYPE